MQPATTALALILALASSLAGPAAAEPPAASPSTPGFRVAPSRAVTLAPHPPLLRPAAVAATGTKAAPEGLQPYTFFPQAGRLAGDLFLYNGTDLDPASGAIRDFECTQYTYDGHQGHDVLVRSFREVEVGVPVFAVLDGTVTRTHDGAFDRNLGGEADAGNYVGIDHGGGHATLYYHLARGSVAVAPGDPVVAGQQIGLTASSGRSTWPHLHFESWLSNSWYEPSAGPCRAGVSQWRQQPPIARAFAVADLYLSAVPIPWETTRDAADGLDPALRTGTFLVGTERLWGRIDMHNLPGGSTWHLRLRAPDGAVVAVQAVPAPGPSLTRYQLERFELAGRLDRPGLWRLQVELDGAMVAEAPLRVVAKARAARNRPPNRVGVRYASSPRAGEVATCLVETSLVHEDPDYDLVRYRYQWLVGRRTLRSVTSAALADHLRRDLVRGGEQLTCRVTPHDGKVAGKPAQARARVAR